MLYPINSQDTHSNIIFQKQMKIVPNSNLKEIARLELRLFVKANALKKAYIEFIDIVKNNSVLANKILSEFNNIEIADNILTILGENNNSFKLSVVENDLSKLFRIKSLNNNELQNVITLDSDKIVERIDRTNIIYLKKDNFKEEEFVSNFEHIYNSLYEPFVEINKYIRKYNYTQNAHNNSKTTTFTQLNDKKEIIPGITADMLPPSTISYQEKKPLFSYAAIIEKTPTASKRKKSSQKKSSIDTNKNSTLSKHIKSDSPKNNSITTKKIVTPQDGEIPKSFTRKIKQIEELYQEISNLCKNFSESKFSNLKRIFNINFKDTGEIHFDEANGNIISISKNKNSKLLSISLVNKANNKNFFVAIDNAKKVVNNIYNSQKLSDNKKITYRTQNEVNNIVYTSDFQATIDKIIIKLTELKKLLDNEKWKIRQNNTINPKTITEQEKPNFKNTKNILINSLSTPTNFIINKVLLKEIEDLWQELKNIDTLMISKGFQKKDFSFFAQEPEHKGFNFIDTDKTLLFDKIESSIGKQYQIILKKKQKIKEHFVITEVGEIIKNAKNTNSPESKITKIYKRLKLFSNLYKQELESTIGKTTPENTLIEKKNGIINTEVSTIEEVKTSSDFTSKFSEIILKIKLGINEVLNKFNKDN